MIDLTGASAIGTALFAAGFGPLDVAVALTDDEVGPTLDVDALAHVLLGLSGGADIDRAGLAAALRAADRYDEASVLAALDRWRPAAQGSSLVFDGASGVTVASHPGLDLGRGPFTIEAMVRTTRGGVVVRRMGGRGDGFGLGIDERGTLLFVTGEGGWTWLAMASTSLLDTGWHHVAAVRDGERFSLLVDGQAQDVAVNGRGARPADVDVPGRDLGIGGASRGNQFDGFVGRLAQVRLWGRALTAAELAQAMGRPDAGPRPGLVGRWDGVDRSTADTSAAGAATVVGATVEVSGAPDPVDAAWPGPSPGEVGLALRPVVAATSAEWAQGLLGLSGWDVVAGTGGALDLPGGGVRSAAEGTLGQVMASGPVAAVDVVSYLCVTGPGAGGVRTVGVYPATRSGSRRYQGFDGTRFVDGPAVTVSGDHRWYRSVVRWDGSEDDVGAVYVKAPETALPFTVWAFVGRR